ncbi:transposase, IS4 family [Streptomyces xiamenensis]|uniref:Transposase, IS4 family n=1 Tax=Streptomyces xiamenensis TaxID=408015 RepID=A0A0F7CMR0_9ACTN|nr:transposase, IS4 family [Streptomyces xiamenensis]
MRAEPDVFGPVASDPTVYRFMDALAASGSKALAATRAARSEVHGHVWDLVGASSPAAEGWVIVDDDVAGGERGVEGGHAGRQDVEAAR